MHGGHSGIGALAFSPDGKWLASDGQDQTVKLWNCEDGSLWQTFPVVNGWQSRLIFSRDGRTFARADLKGIDLYSVAERRSVGGFSPRGAGPGCDGDMAFSPDGTTFVAGCRSVNEQLSFWRISDHLWVKGLLAHEWSIRCLAFTPDSRMLISASSNGKLKWWRLEDGATVFVGHNEPMRVFGVKSSGNAPDKTVAIPESRNLVISPDSSILAAVVKEGIKLIATTDGNPLRTIKTGPIRSVTFSPDGALLYGTGLTFSHGGTNYLKAWRVSDGAETLAIGAADNLGSFKTVACSRELIAANDNEDLKLWRASDGAPVRTLTYHQGAVLSVVCSPRGDVVVSGGMDKKIRIWRAAGGLLLHTLTGHVAVIRSLAISPDGSTLASGGGDGVVNFWNMSDGTFQRALGTKGQKHIIALAFSPGGDLIATVEGATTTLQGKAQLWRTADGQLSGVLDSTNGVRSVAFSADGQKIICGCRTGVRIFRVSDGSLDRSIQEWPPLKRNRPFIRAHDIEAVCFSSDGTLFAAGSSSGSCVWRSEDGTLISHSKAPAHFVKFSLDDRHLLTAKHDSDAYHSNLSALSVATGHLAWSLDSGPNGFEYSTGQTCSLGPKQDTLAIGRRDGTVLFVRMEPPAGTSR